MTKNVADPCYFWPRNFGSSFLYVLREMTIASVALAKVIALKKHHRSLDPKPVSPNSLPGRPTLHSSLQSFIAPLADPKRSTLVTQTMFGFVLQRRQSMRSGSSSARTATSIFFVSLALPF